MRKLKNEHIVFIEKTADKLAEFLDQHLSDIEEKYDWKFDIDRVPETIKFDFDTLTNWYQRTVKLKELLIEKIKNSQSFNDRYLYAEYFVVIWGHVKTNKKLKENLKKYDKVDDLSTISTIDGISSWSKYISLRKPDAAIYDSRVAYAINTINYLSDNLDFFFPIPNGRSPKLGLLDIETLFLKAKLQSESSLITTEDLMHRQISNRIKNKYYLPESINYNAYLTLIDRTAEKLKLKTEDKHKIEMLLFALAPKEIFNELVNKIRNPSGK